MALETRKNPVIDKLARALLASSCLTGAAGIATASTIITEGIAPAPAEFPVSAPGYILPVGTTEVIGTLNGCSECGVGEDVNWFEFQGLLPSASFDFSPCCEGEGTSYSVFNTTMDNLGNCNLEAGCDVIGAVPTNGKLVVRVVAECGECGTQNYQLSLTSALAPGTPEPSTLATAGLALAGALAWRRKRTRIN